MLKQIHALLTDLAGTEEYYFATPIHMRLPPMNVLLSIYAACAGPNGMVAVLDNDDTWPELDEDDRNFKIVANAIYHRLQYIKGQREYNQQAPLKVVAV